MVGSMLSLAECTPGKRSDRIEANIKRKKALQEAQTLQSKCQEVRVENTLNNTLVNERKPCKNSGWNQEGTRSSRLKRLDFSAYGSTASAASLNQGTDNQPKSPLRLGDDEATINLMASSDVMKKVRELSTSGNTSEQQESKQLQDYPNSIREKRQLVMQAWKDQKLYQLSPYDLAHKVRQLVVPGLTAKILGEYVKRIVTLEHGPDFSRRYSAILNEWNYTLSNLTRRLLAKGKAYKISPEERIKKAEELMRLKEARKSVKEGPHPSNHKRRILNLAKIEKVGDHFRELLKSKGLQMDDLTAKELEKESRGLYMDNVTARIYTKRLIAFIESNSAHGKEDAQRFRTARCDHVRDLWYQRAHGRQISEARKSEQIADNRQNQIQDHSEKDESNDKY